MLTVYRNLNRFCKKIVGSISIQSLYRTQSYNINLLH